MTEETVSLEEMGADAFTPYVFDRNPAWVMLPTLALALVAAHLIKARPRAGKSLRTGAELSPLKDFERRK